MNSRIIMRRCSDRFYSLLGTAGGLFVGGLVGIIVSTPFYNNKNEQKIEYIILPLFIVVGTMIGASIDLWRWQRSKNMRELVAAQLRMTPEELAAMGATDTDEEMQPRNQENKILIDWVKQVLATAARHAPLLSAGEIEQFKKILITLPEQQILEKKLKEYEAYFQDMCMLSGEIIQDIKNPITIRGSIQLQNKIGHWVSTYNSDKFIRHLETTPVLAKDPMKNCPLIDNETIKLENGFASHQLLFILTIREKIKLLKPNANPLGFFATQPATEIATNTLSISLKI